MPAVQCGNALGQHGAQKEFAVFTRVQFPLSPPTLLKIQFCSWPMDCAWKASPSRLVRVLFISQLFAFFIPIYHIHWIDFPVSMKGAKDASTESVGIVGAAIAGSGAAVAASVALCPTELIKCRLQAALETHAPSVCHDPLAHPVYPKSSSGIHSSHSSHSYRLQTNCGALESTLVQRIRQPSRAVPTRLGFGLSASLLACPTATRHASSHVTRSHLMTAAEAHLYAYWSWGYSNFRNFLVCLENYHRLASFVDSRVLFTIDH